MEESDQDISEEVDSENEIWPGLIPGPDQRTEQCALGKDTLNLPELLLEKVGCYVIFYHIPEFHHCFIFL